VLIWMAVLVAAFLIVLLRELASPDDCTGLGTII
jgi:hypothetical protein